MTKVYTFELPDYDDYNIVSEILPDGTSVAHQYYYKNGQMITQADIHFNTLDNEPLKWPYKFVMKDISGQIIFTQTTE